MTEANLLGKSGGSLGGAQWGKFAQAFPFWQRGSRGGASPQPPSHPLP